jgi:hypothetical protein
MRYARTALRDRVRPTSRYLAMTSAFEISGGQSLARELGRAVRVAAVRIVHRCGAENLDPITTEAATTASASGKKIAARSRARGLVANHRRIALSRRCTRSTMNATRARSCSTAGISSSQFSRVKITNIETSRGSERRSALSIFSRILVWLEGRPIKGLRFLAVRSPVST